jgi:hypothetical protein
MQKLLFALGMHPHKDNCLLTDIYNLDTESCSDRIKVDDRFEAVEKLLDKIYVLQPSKLRFI